MGAYRRENGWWIGEYTFLGADGNPFISQSDPYRLYDHYKGFIHLEIEGCQLKQRNIFLNPSSNDSLGGDERLFQADQDSNSLDGTLEGPYFTFSTKTTVLNDITVLYEVRDANGNIFQNQLTTLPTEEYRVRSAQGFFNGFASYLSFYRETKVTEQEFYYELNKTRIEYNIKPDNYALNTQQDIETYFNPIFDDYIID